LSNKRGLGRGLEALLPGTAGEKDGKLREININDIVPNHRQPRKAEDDEKQAELAGSIQEHGIVQPVVVRPLGGGKYELIAGERRWRACRSLDMQKIPAVIREYGDLEAAAVALIENVQRENLNSLEEARAYKILMEDFGLTQEDVSRRVGKSRPFVGNMVRLLSLPEEIQGMLAAEQLTTSHARVLLGISEKSRQLSAAVRIIKNQMNVRQAERLVKKMTERRVRMSGRSSRERKLMEQELSRIISAKVRIRENKEGGGKVILDFNGRQEMTGFLEGLMNKSREQNPEFRIQNPEEKIKKK